MSYLDVTGVLVLTLCALLYFCYKSSHKKRAPGPWGVPLLGYLPFLGDHPAKKYFELSKKYGPIITVKLGPETFTVLNDYESIQEALVKNSKVFAGRPSNGFSPSIGIVFHQYDRGYRIHQKLICKTLRGFGAANESIEAKVLEEVDCVLHEIRLSNGKSINCRRLMGQATANVTSNVILGSRYSYQNEDFQEMVRYVSCDVTADKVTSLCLNLLMVAPSLRYMPPFAKAYKVILDGRERMRDIIQKVVEEHRADFDPHIPRDYIDQYLVNMDSNDEKASSFSREQLYRIISDLFIAGTETTSSTIAWALLLLVHRPDIQSNLYEEIRKVVGDERPSQKHKSKMPYFNAFIQELMRHRTLIPLALPHCVLEDVCINGHDIPKGGAVLINLWAIHHNPDYFKHPEEFTPERFIDDNGAFFKDPKIIAFSAGPRACPGEYIGKLQVFQFLSGVIQKYELHKDDAIPLPPFDEGIVGAVEIPKDFQVIFKLR